MANKIVLYKLIPFGNGFIAPTGIKNGGVLWESNGVTADMILVGEIDESLVSDPLNFPEGILEIITKTKRTRHLNEQKAKALDDFKQACFKRDTDPMFVEAMRKKEMGNTKKWNIYVNRVNIIKNITSIFNERILYNDEDAPMNIFSKRLVRKVMKDLNLETELNNLLNSSDEIKTAWEESDVFDLSDSVAQAALSGTNLDIDAIKAQLLESMEE